MSDLAGVPAAQVRSLYIHVPFCERKCEYCDFMSVAGRRGERAYVQALCRELHLLASSLPDLVLDTVFVGGGTPSFIEPHRLAAVLGEVRAGFRVSPGAEITLEANPSSIDESRAAVWRMAGFNRVSIGVQSLDADSLRFLGRVHDAERARSAVREVRKAGFDNVNCDLIYAIPGLCGDMWRRTVEEVASWQTEHVSCYELTVEPHTPLHAAVRRGRVRPVSAEPALEQHWVAVDALERAGFAQYEVSNFARPGRDCRHNLTYWRCGYYVAAGVGAHGHLPAALAPALGLERSSGVAVRYWHGRGIGAYIDAVESGSLGVGGAEVCDAATHDIEALMLGLRLAEGVPYVPGANNEIDRLVADGLLSAGSGRVRATRRGQEVLDAVIRRACNPATTLAPMSQTVG
jgi:oxygen-independent coproporphyrinogen III oxidase